MTSIAQLVPRMGGLAWIARSLFQLEGRWAESMADPVATIHLATQSRYHGWHATLWAEALPDSPALEAAGHVVAPSMGWQSAVDLVGDAVDSEGNEPDVARLSALYRVFLPRLMVELVALEEGLDGPGDAHIERVAGLVRADATADLIGGLALLNATFGHDDAVEIAAATAQTLDQTFRN